MRVTRPAGLLLMMLMLTACSDDDSPTSPTVIPPVAGTWTGTYRVRTCTEQATSPTGTPLCPGLLAGGGTFPPVTFTLVQAAGQANITGTVTFGGWLANAGTAPPPTGGTGTPGTSPVGLTLPMTGLVDRSGAVLLQGTTTRTDPACPGMMATSTLTDLNMSLTRDKNGFTSGTFTLVANVPVTTCTNNAVTITADQLTATLTAPAPPTTTTAK